MPGGADKRYGVHVAQPAGIPQPILTRSQKILEEWVATFAKEATGESVVRHKTQAAAGDVLFVQKHTSVIDNLTPIEAINLLSQIKVEMPLE